MSFQNAGATHARAKERDTTISDLKQRLVKVSSTRDNIKLCLDRASDSLKMALELNGGGAGGAEEEEEQGRDQGMAGEDTFVGSLFCSFTARLNTLYFFEKNFRVQGNVESNLLAVMPLLLVVEGM